MSANTTPIFTLTPRTLQAQLSNANNSARDHSGTVSSALSVGANGSSIDYILFQSITTTAAGLLRLFYSPDSGTTWRLIAEIPTNAVTVSGTVGGDQHVWIPPGGIPMVVPSTGQFSFTNSTNSETWNMLMVGGDY